MVAKADAAGAVAATRRFDAIREDLAGSVGEGAVLRVWQRTRLRRMRFAEIGITPGFPIKEDLTGACLC